jgi:hypothetical protein
MGEAHAGFLGGNRFLRQRKRAIKARQSSDCKIVALQHISAFAAFSS